MPAYMNQCTKSLNNGKADIKCTCCIIYLLTVLLYCIYYLLYSDITADEDRFLGAIIVLEEFCKELAAISFAKHHILF